MAKKRKGVKKGKKKQKARLRKYDLDLFGTKFNHA